MIQDEGVAVYLEGSEQPLTLTPDPQQAGIFRGRLRASEPGPAMVYLPVDGDPEREFIASARFVVSLPSRETEDISQDRAALDYLTKQTRGLKVQIEDADTLLDELDGGQRVERVLSSQQRDFPPMPLLFVLLGVASAEWLLRRRLNLS